MLRDGGLRDVELPLNHFADLAGAELAVGEQLEHAAADRIAEDVECVHASMYCVATYISQERYESRS